MPAAATIAVAGPITAGEVRLTNRDWLISEAALRRCGCRSALLINDFIALAFAVQTLGSNDLRTVGPIGAGTGG